jgi:hypothetical protein
MIAFTRKHCPVSLEVGHVPERSSNAVAITRGNTTKVLAYCRSDADAAELVTAIAELLGVDLSRMPQEEIDHDA